MSKHCISFSVCSSLITLYLGIPWTDHAYARGAHSCADMCLLQSFAIEMGCTGSVQKWIEMKKRPDSFVNLTANVDGYSSAGLTEDQKTTAFNVRRQLPGAIVGMLKIDGFHYLGICVTSKTKYYHSVCELKDLNTDWQTWWTPSRIQNWQSLIGVSASG